MVLIDIFNICLIEKSQFVCPNDIDLLIDFFQLNYEFPSGQVIDFKIEFLIEFLIEFPWLAACCFLAFSFWCLHGLLFKGGTVQAILVERMGGKGGARNFVKSFIDPGLLFQALSKHEDMLPEFGLYDTISRNQSIDPKGLVQVLPLVKDLIKVSPSAEIHTDPLRAALLRVVCHNPSVNTSKWNGTVWANIRCERIGVLLLHMRRLKSSDEVRKAAAKLTQGTSCSCRRS